MTTHTIELDCAPGFPRPDMLLPGILEGTGFTPEDVPCISTFFGNWTFAIPEDRTAEYKAIRHIVKARVVALYDAGSIRYGSW